MTDNLVANAITFRIMIADDDALTRDVLRTALQRPDWEIFLCEDGFQAMDFCQSKPLDMAILDVNMPGPNGVEICSWIKNRDSQQFTPVILLTAERKLKQKLYGLNCGADEYLTKPFKSSELIAHIEAMLRIKKLTDELKATKHTLSLKEKQLFKMQLAGAAAHELGQPLTQIMIGCQTIPALVMQDDSKLSPQEKIARNEQIRMELNSLLSLCNEMKQIIQKMAVLTEFKTKAYIGKEEIIDGLGAES